MTKGYQFKFVLFALLLITLLSGCSLIGTRNAGDSNTPIVQLEPAALLASSRSVTANRLLKEALQVEDDRDLCEGLITHNKRLSVLRYKKPPHGKFYRDATFNTRAIRITDSEPNEVHKPIHSAIQAWNADESLLLLHRFKFGENEYRLFDGHTYQFVSTLSFATSDIRHLLWSHTDPDILFYISKEDEHQGWFMRYNVRTNGRQRIRKFDNICANSTPSWENNVQMQSLDNDLFGFRCETPTGHAMLSYRISTDAVAQIEAGKDTNWASSYAPMPAPSGVRMEIEGQVMTPDLSLSLHSLDQALFEENSSLGRTNSGQDALFQTTFDPSPKGCNGSKHGGVAHLAEFNLESGKCRAVISQANGWPYTTTGTQVSAVGRHRPGWVAMSSVGYGDLAYLTGGSQAPALTSEIYLVNTDPGDTKLCRLAQHRTFAKEALNGDYPAKLGQPHVTLSPSGTRVLFGSDWYDSGSVDSYVIELRAYTDSKNR